MWKALPCICCTTQSLLPSYGKKMQALSSRFHLRKAS